MKTFRPLVLSIFIIFAPVHFAQAQSPLGNFLKDLQKTLGIGGLLSSGKIADGLKEALEIGTANAIQTVSRVGGYYNNPEIKIPLPAAVQKMEKILRLMGYGPQVDAFVRSMNQAAEKAAPEAKRIFLDAIKQMTITDARKILNGPENAATLYFKEKTYGALTGIFKPIVHKSMEKVGVTNRYYQLEQKVAGIPILGTKQFDLDTYVNDKALDGLFLMIAEEERRIREDPAARVTDLLKQVFGKR